MRNEPRQPARPSHLWIPEHADFRLADDVAEFARLIGDDIAEPEVDAYRVLNATDDTGLWLTLESALIAGRQNLKTRAGLISALYSAFILGTKHILWTAHEYKTAHNSFLAVQEIFSAVPWLDGQVLQLRRANGDEGFTLRNGARFDVVARTAKSGRGFSADEVWLDEGLYVTNANVGALMPTMSARPNGRIAYLSSPGIRESEQLREIRDRGRKGQDESLTYAEWTSERLPCALEAECSHKTGVVGCQLDNRDLWWSANPALGRRMSERSIAAERRSMPVLEFMRERLGWWEDPPPISVVDSGIPTEGWASREDSGSKLEPGCRVAVAVDLSWDRSTAWIAVAGERPDGQTHVEIIERGAGVRWVMPFLEQFCAIWKPVGVGFQAGNAPIASIGTKISEAFEDAAVPLNFSELARGCGLLFDAVAAESVVHIGQAAVDNAIDAAVVRKIGDAWVWDRRDSPLDVAPLVAITSALFILATSVESPESVYETHDLLVL